MRHLGTEKTKLSSCCKQKSIMGLVVKRPRIPIKARRKEIGMAYI